MPKDRQNVTTINRGQTPQARQQQEQLDREGQLPSDKLQQQQEEYLEGARQRREANIRRAAESKGLDVPSFTNIDATREQVTDTISAEEQPAPANINQPRHGFDYTTHGVPVAVDENDNEILPQVHPGTLDTVPPVGYDTSGNATEQGMRTNRNFIHEEENQQLGTQPGVLAHPAVRFEGHPDVPPKEAENSKRAMINWAKERLNENIWRDPVMAVRQFREDVSNHPELKNHTYANLMQNRCDNGAGIDELLEIAESMLNEQPSEEEEKTQKEQGALPSMNWHPVPVGKKWAGPINQPVQSYPGQHLPNYVDINDEAGAEVHRKTAEEQGWDIDWERKGDIQRLQNIDAAQSRTAQEQAIRDRENLENQQQEQIQENQNTEDFGKMDDADAARQASDNEIK